jgi:acetylornithine deacetylase/succinyl-diaminopimelate desuccinylase-like protein
MVTDLQQRCGHIATAEGVEIVLDRFWTIQPTDFDPVVLNTIRQVAATMEIAPVEVWSGAGHDAKYAADIMPTGMIFVRSRGGVSHCEEEYSSADDIALGAELLLRATLLLARAT